jgi:hypothetical protein
MPGGAGKVKVSPGGPVPDGTPCRPTPIFAPVFFHLACIRSGGQRE